MFFISCFYMVIINSGDNYYTHSLRNTSAFDIFVWTYCNHGNENGQSVIMPYVYNVGHESNIFVDIRFPICN